MNNIKIGSCFYCRNCTNNRQEDRQWLHDCLVGVENDVFDGSEDIRNCPKADPRHGFQMGGYYTHMWFETDPITTPKEVEEYGIEVVRDRCLTWTIQGDLEFPISDEDRATKKPIEIHICDFTQIEEWVKIWGKELRRRGWIVDDETALRD